MSREWAQNGIPAARGPALLPATEPPPWGPVEAALESCAARWRAYRAAPVDGTVTPLDDMFTDTPEGRAHYDAVGLSALRLATDAMVLTGRIPARILDLPCGGGRVTRHLVRFFPEARIDVADIDAAKVAAVVEQFGVGAIETSRDFSAPLPQSYDMIFVGSLLTHFDADLFARTTHRLLDALNPGGVLILTTAGRNWAAACHVSDRANGDVPGGWWSPVLKRLTGGRVRGNRRLRALVGPYARTGFAYIELRGWTEQYGQSYGGSFAAPSWLMRLVERRTDTMVIGLKERGFGDLLDAILLQRCA